MSVAYVIEALRREQRELDQEIKAKADRRAEIDVAISVLEGMGDKLTAPPQSDGDNQAAPDAPQEQLAARPAEPRPTREEGPQAALRRLLRARPSEEIDSKAAYELLLADGWQSNSNDQVNVVRTALAAMAKRGEIVKRARGKYAYEPVDAVAKKPTEPTVVPGTLGFVESDYGSASYSQGTSLSEPAETMENPRRAHDPFAPRRVAVNRDDRASGA